MYDCQLLSNVETANTNTTILETTSTSRSKCKSMSSKLEKVLNKSRLNNLIISLMDF